MTSKTVVLVTGPQRISPDYFRRYYVPALTNHLKAHPDAEFVLGDADGVDQMAQQWLVDNNHAPDRVTVCIKAGEAPRLASHAFRVDATAPKFPARDLMMAERATHVICCLPQFGGGTSGSLLPVLAFSSKSWPLDTPTKICNMIRTFSEPYDEAFAKIIAEVYRLHYTPIAGSSQGRRIEMIGDIAQMLTDAYVRDIPQILTTSTSTTI